MGYVDFSLLENEQIIRRGQIHWAIFLPDAFLFAFGLLGLIFWCGFGIVVLWAIASMFDDMIRRMTTEMVITNKRVIMKHGWISRRTMELNLGKIENLSVEQDLLGRIMDFGTVTVVGTGGSREKFKYVAEPMGFRKTIQDLSH